MDIKTQTIEGTFKFYTRSMVTFLQNQYKKEAFVSVKPGSGMSNLSIP